MSASKDFPVSLPTRLDPKATKVDSVAFYVASALLSGDSGAMVKYSEAGQEANVLAFQIAANAAALSGGPSLDSGATDDDGGAETPLQPEAAQPAPASSNSLEIRSADAPAIKTAIIRTSASDRIGAVLTANGFSDESSGRIEAAFKTLFNFQSLPPGGGAAAIGERDATGAYRVGQLVIYQGADYIGTVALSENGSYLEGARPAVASNLLDDSGTSVALNARYTLADGLYSAGLRSAVPESIVREAIQLIGHGVDLKAPLTADETFKALYARDARGKAKDSGRIIYVGVAGSAGAYDCYVYESEDSAFGCFDPKAASHPSSEPTHPSLSATSGRPASPSASEAAPAKPTEAGPPRADVTGLPAPIRGAPITSLFGMRFHPILHYMRLHAGIDFGAPVGSPVRAVEDGKVEIAGEVSGFGNHVRIQHKGFETSYSHLSEILATTHPGAEVKRGDLIAYSGNTGLSTGPHLHFEFYLEGTAVDPLPHMGGEALAGGPMEGVAHTGAAAAAGPHLLTPQEIAEFAAFKAQIDAVLATEAR